MESVRTVELTDSELRTNHTYGCKRYIPLSTFYVLLGKNSI
jgi:hypothetical protein